jgi:twitching motility protein PilI
MWAGVLFQAGGHALLAALTEVEEVLELAQDITRVPAARSWVLGIANNRGALLPIFDLQDFLFGIPTARSPNNRVLVARRDGPSFGILVSDVIGIRHFDASAHVAQVPPLGKGIDELIEGGCRSGDEVSPVLSLQRLGADPRFNMAAA